MRLYNDMTSYRLQPLQGPVEAAVAVPGSKSYTNRALIMAALTKGPVTVRQPLVSDDTRAMLRCLRTLGIECIEKDGAVIVAGDVSQVRDGSYDLDCDISGTSIRFLLALACVVPGVKTLYGKEGLNKRPIGDLVEGLRLAGARIEYAGHDGFPPLRVLSSSLTSGTIKMSGAVSSQYFSAILMVSSLAGGMTIEVEGEQISKPYIDMTLDTMRQFGVTASNEDYKRYVIPGGDYRIDEYTVEGDVSSASYFFAIAALTDSRITVNNLNPTSVQADMGFLKILEKMDSEVSFGERSVTVHGHGVKPLSVNMENCPDQAQTLAVLAAFADGTTVISGVRSLRIKETERVRAVENELAKMGIKTESTQDTLTIFGGSPKCAVIDTYGDHRMAMSFAVAGTKLPGVVVSDPAVVGKTFPGFWDTLVSIGVSLEKSD